MKYQYEIIPYQLMPNEEVPDARSQKKIISVLAQRQIAQIDANGPCSACWLVFVGGVAKNILRFKAGPTWPRRQNQPGRGKKVEKWVGTLIGQHED